MSARDSPSADGSSDSASIVVETGPQKASAIIVACAYCYKMRRRCNREPGSKECTQCKGKRLCVPRKAGDKYTRKKDSKKEKVKDKSGADEIVSGFKLLSIVQTPRGGGINQAEDANNNAEEWFKALKYLGLEKAPPTLCMLVRSIFLRANKRKSMTELHNATCIALATGVEISLEWIKDSPAPISRAALEEHHVMLNRMLSSKSHQWAFLRIDCCNGERLIWANGLYSEFFEAFDAVKEQDHRYNFRNIWKSWIADIKVYKNLMSTYIMQALLNPADYSLPNSPTTGYKFESPSQVEVVDNLGYKYSATIILGHQLSVDGAIATPFFAMANFSPKCSQGAQRLADFQKRAFSNPASVEPARKPTSDKLGQPIYQSVEMVDFADSPGVPTGVPIDLAVPKPTPRLAPTQSPGQPDSQLEYLATGMPGLEQPGFEQSYAQQSYAQQSYAQQSFAQQGLVQPCAAQPSAVQYFAPPEAAPGSDSIHIHNQQAQVPSFVQEPTVSGMLSPPYPLDSEQDMQYDDYKNSQYAELFIPSSFEELAEAIPSDDWSL